MVSPLMSANKMLSISFDRYKGNARTTKVNPPIPKKQERFVHLISETPSKKRAHSLQDQPQIDCSKKIKTLLNKSALMIKTLEQIKKEKQEQKLKNMMGIYNNETSEAQEINTTHPQTPVIENEWHERNETYEFLDFLDNLETSATSLPINVHK